MMDREGAVPLAEGVQYICPSRDGRPVVPPEFCRAAETLCAELENRCYIGVYPDAEYERWGLPKGLVVIFPLAEAILLPTFLRDPASGFLLFDVRFTSTPPMDWQEVAGQALDRLVRRDFQEPLADSADGSLPEAVPKLTAPERALLERDFGAIANTVELKQVDEVIDPRTARSWRLSLGDIVGFVHAGSGPFGRILEDRFAYAMAEDCLDRRIFSLSAVEQGIYGIPLATDLGTAYYRYLGAAMAYGSASRNQAFLRCRRALETVLPCQVSLRRDTIHSGITEHTLGSRPILKMFRGVQPLLDANRDDFCASPATLLAGQKETVSLLVAAGPRAAEFHDMISHGTDGRIPPPEGRPDWIPFRKTRYLSLASAAYYNTPPDLDRCLPHTSNLWSAMEHFQACGLASAVCTLAPVVNIQGEDLL